MNEHAASCRIVPHLSSMCTGYDGRRDSRQFAHLAAAVFVSQGVQVYLFSEMVPTPFVAAAVGYKVAPA